MTKILVSRALPESVMETLAAEFDVTFREIAAPMTADEVTDALGAYDGILPTLGDAFTAAAIQAAGDVRCKVLANFGVGYNHIDAAVAAAAGMVVTNTPGAVTDATADIAMTLMLSTARRASAGERMVRAGGWSGWHPVQMLGMHLTGKTVGIVGMGRIGKAIAKRCHAGFDMDVVFYNRSQVADVRVAARQLDTIADVAAVADVVVVAVPGGPATHHLMNADVFAAMQSHAILVNIARGDVVDEAALIAALQSGAIGGAGLDVYEKEPIVPEALIAMENVVLLPHLGTAALEVREDMGQMAVANLRAFFAGEDVPNPV